MFRATREGRNEMGAMTADHFGKYWQTVVGTMADGVIVVDHRCRILETNQALEEMTGYDKETLAGQPCTILGCDVCTSGNSRSGGYRKNACDLFASGRVVRRRCRLRRKDGSTLHVLKNAAILRDGSGATVGGVETITDITDLV